MVSDMQGGLPQTDCGTFGRATARPSVALLLPAIESPEADADDVRRFVCLGRMISAVAHELGNRLTSVTGYVDLLALKTLAPESQRMVHKLRIHAEALRSLAEGLSGMSRSSRSAGATHSLPTLVRQVVEIAQCEAHTRGVILALTAQPGLSPCALVAAEFRLGFFACLDVLIRRLAPAKGQEPTNIRVEMRQDAGELSGIRIFLRAESPTDPAGRLHAAVPELEYGRRILAGLGVRSIWTPHGPGGAVLALEVTPAAGAAVA